MNSSSFTVWDLDDNILDAIPSPQLRSPASHCIGGLDLNWTLHRVTYRGHEILISPLDMRLLKFFLEAPLRVYAREEILDAAWPAGIYVTPRTVDVHIASLRKALREANAPDVIRTVRSRGYARNEHATR